MAWYRNRYILIKIALGIILSGLYLGGFLKPLDNFILDQKFRLIDSDPTGTLTLIEIDSKSLQAIDRWPWSRKYHAELLERLVADRAEKIAFDVDFSSRSTEEDDRLFEESLGKKPGQVILPTLKQFQRTKPDDAQLHKNLPLERFQPYIQSGSVNVFPDKYGVVRRFYIANSFNNDFVLSLSGLLTGQGYFEKPSFLIDYSIDPHKIRRISYVDVLNGTYDRNLITGKNILVGATAIELSDNFSVPNYGILPGVIVQALAYESILQDRQIQNISAPSILLINVVLFVALIRLRKYPWQKLAWLYTGLIVLLYSLSLTVQSFSPYNLEIVAWVLMITTVFFFDLFVELERRAHRLVEERIINSMNAAMISQVVQDNFDGIIITDRDGKIKLCNETARELLAEDRENMIDHSVFDYIPDVMEETIILTHKTDPLATNHASALEREVTLSDGRHSVIELTISRSAIATDSNKKFNFLHAHEVLSFTFRDITKRKKMEEREKEAMEQLVLTNRAKNEFLTNMSHELRTPLNAIIGFSDIILQQMFGKIEQEKYIDYAQDINSSGQNLLSILNDILDVSKIETGEFSLNEDYLDLEEILHSCVKIADGWAANTGKILTSEFERMDFDYFADARLIKQIVLNLLSNAFKFTGENGKISLHSFFDAARGVVIEVNDDGIGIPEDVIPQITNAFYQVDGSLSRNHDGAGLGLYLMDKYLQLHNGTFEIESIVNQGTLFRVILPLERIEELPLSSASI